MEFLKEKWYWILGGLLGVWIVMKLMGHSSSSAALSNTGYDPYQAYSNPSVITATTNADAGLQVAQINAQSGLAAQQIAAASAVNLAQIAEKATENTNAANVSVAGINANRDVTLGNQAMQLGIVNSNNQLSAIQNTNATQLGITQSNNVAQVAEVQNTNAAKLAAYGIQAGVVSQQISSAQAVALAETQAQKDVQLSTLQTIHQSQVDQINAQNHQYDVVQNLLGSGAINLNHGTSSVEQANLNALLALLHPSSVGEIAGAQSSEAFANAYGAAATTPNWGAIAGSATSALKLLFG